MIGKSEETAGATRRRQHRQQRQQQQAQQPTARHGPGLPEKQHQTKHNPASEKRDGSLGNCDQ